MANNDSWIAATQILPELKKLTGQQPEIGVRKLVELAASARLPLVKRDGRWGVPRKDLHAVANALGMTVTA